MFAPDAALIQCYEVTVSSMLVFGGLNNRGRLLPVAAAHGALKLADTLATSALIPRQTQKEEFHRR